MASVPLSIRALAVAMLLALVVAAGTASADRKPNDREKSKITAALDRAGFSCDIFPEGSRCKRTIRVSTVNERWAAAYIRGDSNVQGGDASLQRRNHRWRVHQIGNGGGCGLPAPVADDLQLACY